jgi:hypothetical protein
VERRLSKVVPRYVKGWLLLDVLAALPASFIASATPKQYSAVAKAAVNG